MRGAAGGLAARLLTVGLQFVIVPFALSVLGPDGFGLWMLLASFVGLSAFADFGLGTGLLNLVTQRSAQRDEAGLVRCISSAYAAVMAMAAAAAIAGYGLLLLGGDLLGANRNHLLDGRSALVIGGGIALVSVPAGLVNRVLTGLQKTLAVSVFSALGAVVSVVLQVLVLLLWPSVPAVLAVTLAGPLIANLFATFWTFTIDNPTLRPQLSAVNLADVRVVARYGFMFFVLQLCTAILVAVDNAVLGWASGLAAVGAFAFCTRAFGVVHVAVGASMSPLWPAFGDAQAHGDSAWIRTTLRRSTLVALGAGLLLSLLVTIALLVGGALIAPGLEFQTELLFAFMLSTALWNGAVPVSMYLNARMIVVLQIMIGISYAALSVVLKLWWIRPLGASGLVWGGLVAFLLTAILPYLIILPRLMAENSPKNSA